MINLVRVLAEFMLMKKIGAMRLKINVKLLDLKENFSWSYKKVWKDGAAQLKRQLNL